MLNIIQKNDRNKGKHELFARRRHSDFSLKLVLWLEKCFFPPDHFAKMSAVILYEIPIIHLGVIAIA